MDKKNILQKIIERLQVELEVLISSAKGAEAAATGEESKAENKYDTRGLESSYLAAGQAKRAQELQKAMTDLEKLELKSYSKNSAIGSTALVKTLIDDSEVKWFFVLPQKGGEKVQVNDIEITSLSMNSPLGELLVGQRVGDEFIQKVGSKEKEYFIEEVL